MLIQRGRYINQLKSKRDNGRIKVITGIRRCGKSYMLGKLYRGYLLSNGVKEEQIIELDLDDNANLRMRNPIELDSFIREAVSDKSIRHYIFIDEIQMVANIPNPYLPKDSDEKITFVDVILGLNKLPNVDIYVTGSNSRMLSADIVTEMRDRADEIRIYPLTFDEFFPAFGGDVRQAWREFFVYGGMPYTLQLPTHEEKSQYLRNLFSITYIRDVIERYHLRKKTETLDELLNFVASAVGSLTNPTRLANTLKSAKKLNIKSDTLANYLDYFIDAFVLSKACRYDIKGKSYINTPLKYYFNDIGLRNARINFRQTEENHIMENILYNELCARGFSVDVGIVEYNGIETTTGTKKRIQLEVDFVVNKFDKRFYIQSALTIADEEKRLQEINSLNRISDAYTRYVVVRDDIIPWTDDNGIRYINIYDFLLHEIDNM